MSNTILLKKSGTANAVPGAANLALGEVALNYTDGNLFYKDAGGTVNLLVSNRFVSVAGNITGGNLNAAGMSLSSNVVSALNVTGAIAGANLTTPGLISATGNITGGNLNAAGLSLSGNVLSQINSTSNITTSGNISGNYILGNIANATGYSASKIYNGNSEVNIGTSAGNANISISGVSNVVVVTTTGLNVTGAVSGSGNITGGNIIGIIAAGSNTITTTANISGGNVNTGIVSATGTITAQDILVGPGITGGTISALGNITSANTLNGAGLSLSGNVVSALVSAANITTSANISANYFIGNGSQLTGLTPNKIFNGTSEANIGTTNGNANISIAGTSNVAVFTTAGLNITGIVSASGNITGANIDTAGLVSAGGNVTGANLVTGGLATVTGNITGGNLITAGAISAASVSASGNVTGGNLITAGAISAASVSASGNVAGGNVLTGGLISAGGTITGANLVTGGLISATGNITSSANILAMSGTVVTENIKNQGGTGIYIAPGPVGYINFFTTAGDRVSITDSGNVSAVGNVVGNVIVGNVATVTGNITGGNLITAAAVSAASVSASGNVTGGNLNAAGLSLSSNVVSALNLSFGLTTATTVVAVGNITGGNLITAAAVSAGSVSASGNITGGNVNTNTIVGTGTTVKSIGDLSLSATGNIVVNSYINGVTTPVQDTDAANKGYVDSVAQGLDPKASVEYATTTALSAYTYNNGTSGVGATITANADGALSIDGSTLSANARVLIKNETSTNAPYNGIYVVTDPGGVSAPFVLTRSADFNQPSEIPSAFTFVEAGGTNADTGWVCTTNAPVVIGVTNITFVQFSGAGQYTANTSAGLSLTGTVFSAKVDGNTNPTIGFDGSGNLYVPAGAAFTTPNIGAATGTSVSVTGNITSGNLNAAGLSLSSNVISALNVTGNIAGSNITTPGLVSAAGTITGGNLAAGSGTISTSGNITGGNVLYGSGIVSGTGNISGGNLNATGLSLSGNVVSAINTTSNITGGNVNGVNGVYSGGVQVLTINDTVDGGTY
jgi:hypothetical protein